MVIGSDVQIQPDGLHDHSSMDVHACHGIGRLVYCRLDLRQELQDIRQRHSEKQHDDQD